MDDVRRIAHLFRRAGFGATLADQERFAKKPLAAAVDHLIEYEREPDALDLLREELAGDLLDLNDPADLKAWWLFRMVRSRRPLQEKMALFWHGHFATSNGKVESLLLMQRQNDLFRHHALGSFRTLLLEVMRDPAMLVYLDGRQNRKGAPNENFARELFELFTLGRGEYTEQDVKEAARAFTGWQVREGEAFFEPKQHDDGEKVILGQKGKFSAEDVIDLVAAHPKTAQRLAFKLARFFVAEEPPQVVVDLLAKEYLHAGFEIGAVLRKLFTSDAFYADDLVGRKVKSPVELAVGALRALPGHAPLRPLARVLVNLGQDLFYPPNVKGWDGGASWFGTSEVVERMNLMKLFVTGQGGNPGLLLNPRQLVTEAEITTPEALVDHLLKRFATLEVTPTVRAKLVEYVLAKDKPEMKPFPAEGTLDAKVRGAAHLVLCLPEFQLA